MMRVPHIPDTAPFTPEQRAWLNGFLVGLLSQTPSPVSVPAPPPTPAGEPLLVLFGSQTGTAESLARRLAKESAERGFAVRVAPLSDFESAGFAQAGKVVIISSTWGDGDPPDNATRFWNWLRSDNAPRLEHLGFAVLGLGDRNYADFCGASKKFDARLQALGAKRLASRGECDVDFEAAATAWMAALWPALSTGSAAAAAVHRNGQSTDFGSRDQNPAAYSRIHPYPARVLKHIRLNKPGSGKEIRHYEIALNGSGMRYEVGDALGVVPVNCPELVGDILTALRASPEENVKLGDQVMSLSEALTRHCDITKPSAEFIAAVGRAAPESNLAALLAPEKREELQQWLWGRQLIDLLHLMMTPFAVADFIPLLRKLSPRLYSISSSPKAHPGEVHLTVNAVRYESHGRARKGVASTFLADRVGETDFVKVFVQPSPSFRLPTHQEVPIIMIGPGTGIAPFRAFLEEREATGAKGKNWLLFGDQRRETDFLYEEQLTAWCQSGLLTRLDLAFSRDQERKIYVQDRLLENAAEVWSWLEAGAHVYVCGDANRMAKDVDNALHRIVEQAGGKTADNAKTYMAKLADNERYRRDVY